MAALFIRSMSVPPVPSSTSLVWGYLAFHCLAMPVHHLVASESELKT